MSAKTRKWLSPLALVGASLAVLWMCLELRRGESLILVAVCAGLCAVVLAYWEAAYSLLVFALIAGMNINFVGPDPVDFLLLPTIFLGFIYGHVQIRKVYFGLGLWVLIGAFLFSFAVSIVAGIPTWYLVGHFIRNVGLFAFLVLYLQSRGRMRLVFAGLVAGLFSTDIVSILAFFGYVRGGALLFPSWSGARFQALMGDANMLGLNGLVILIWLLDETLRPKLWPKARKLKVVLLIVIALQLFATLSRSAWGGTITALLVYAAMSFRWREVLHVPVRFVAARAVAGLGTILLVLLAVNALGMWDTVFLRATTLQGGANYGPEKRRLEMDYTRHAFGLALEHPLGLGPGQTEETDSNGSSVALGKVGAHDTYVQVLSDYGWLAFASFAWILAACAFRMRRLARRKVEELGLSFIWLISALAGCAVLAMFQDILFWPFPWLLPGFVMAALAAGERRKQFEAAA